MEVSCYGGVGVSWYGGVCSYLQQCMYMYILGILMTHLKAITSHTPAQIILQTYMYLQSPRTPPTPLAPRPQDHVPPSWTSVAPSVHQDLVC